MKLLVFSLLLSVAAHAQIDESVDVVKAKKSNRKLEVVDARVDVHTSELVVRFNGADCNGLAGQLVYEKSGRATFGPHHFKLLLMMTQIGCGPSSGKQQLKTVRVKIPLDPADQVIRIEANDKILIYNTKRPLSEDVKIVENKNNSGLLKSKKKSRADSGSEERTEKKEVLGSGGTK